MGCQTSDVHHDDVHHEPEKVKIEPNKDGFRVVLDKCQGEPWPAAPGRLESATLIPQFSVKDSGKREEYESGMVRDTATDKVNVALVLDGPMFWRWAVHLTKGAIKYAKRNWMKAAGEEELERFRESAARHFIQWYNGETDEDHAAAVFFNINGAEYVKGRKK